VRSETREAHEASSSRPRRRRRHGDAGGGVAGEVHLGFGSPDAPRGAVVCARSGLGGEVGAEPDTDALHEVADLRRPLAPRPLPDAAVLVLAAPRLRARRCMGTVGSTASHH
jgi:hypothetical protein